MKAQEMFEKLGFVLYNNTDGPSYKKKIGRELFRILFSDSEKIYYVDGSAAGVSLLEMTVDLHAAITRQMKELGWISE